MISAVGAELGAVALVVSGNVQGDQEGLDLLGWNDDGVLAGWFGRRRFGPRRNLAEGGAERVILGALVDVPEAADHSDGLVSVLAVVFVVAVAFQDVEDVEDQAPIAVIAGHAPFFR